MQKNRGHEVALAGGGRLEDRLRGRMAELRLSNVDLCRQAGVSERLVYKLLSGDENVRRSSVEKIGNAMGVSVEWLLFGTEPPDDERRHDEVREGRQEYGLEEVTMADAIGVIARQLGLPADVVAAKVGELLRGGAK